MIQRDRESCRERRDNPPGISSRGAGGHTLCIHRGRAASTGAGKRRPLRKRHFGPLRCSETGLAISGRQAGTSTLACSLAEPRSAAHPDAWPIAIRSDRRIHALGERPSVETLRHSTGTTSRCKPLLNEKVSVWFPRLPQADFRGLRVALEPRCSINAHLQLFVLSQFVRDRLSFAMGSPIGREGWR